MNKKRANIGSAARAIRIIFDKYSQPWNVAKYTNRDDAICPECGEKDSLQHLATCTHPMYIHTRAHTHAALSAYIKTFATDTLEYYVGNCLHTFVQDIDNCNR